MGVLQTPKYSGMHLHLVKIDGSEKVSTMQKNKSEPLFYDAKQNKEYSLCNIHNFLNYSVFIFACTNKF